MLAIKECLIREGVLNLNPPVNASSSLQYDVNTPPYTLYRNRYSLGSHLNMLNSPQKSTTDISVNDLSSSNSATAKTSCQQQEKESLTKSIQTRKLPKRYQGHHPHFHHHTAPAYYTDLHLKIHTPAAKDSVNENYQSVYRTPSRLIKDEHQFPKTTTATLAAPLPLSPTQNLTKDTEKLESCGSFFRGASQQEQQQPNRNASSYMPSSSVLLKPTKGNSSSTCDFIVNAENLPLSATADGSVVFACTNFKPCVTAVDNPPSITPSRSRNTQRFANRKRAVRVRSESRPISALYDIICKEKGLDIVTTTTNDEDSSASHSREEEKFSYPPISRSRTRRSHSRSASRQTKSSQNSNMSSGLGNNSSGGDHTQHRAVVLQQKKCNDKYSPNTIFINDLSDDDDDDEEINRLEGGCSRKNVRLRHSHKKGNLWDELEQAKSASLPPGLLNLGNFKENYNSNDSLNVVPKNKSDSLVSAKHSTPPPASSLSNPSLSSNNALSVDPLQNMHLSSNRSSQSQQEQQHLVTASPKVDRYARKHRRLRDEKPRRHTDGAIKLYPSQLNDNEDYDGDADDCHRINDSTNHPDHNTPSSLLHHHDLNSAGHDFHNSSNNAANAKRYITRSQRTNETRSSPAVVAPIIEKTIRTTTTLTPQQNQQQEFQTISNSELTTTTNSNHTIAETVNGKEKTTTTTSSEKVPDQEDNQEMTNNSGKKSRTPTATAAAAAATTASTATTATNAKELKLTTSDDHTTISTTNMAAASNVLCSSTADKKKDEEKQQIQQRFTSPTSPKPQHHSHQLVRRASPSSPLDQNQKTASGSETERNKMSNSVNSSPTHRANKKLVPSVSVSMKQNLIETQCTASRSNSLCSNNHSPKSPKQKSPQTIASSTECTVRISASPKVKRKSSSNSSSPKSRACNHNEDDLDDDFLEINDLPVNEDGSKASARPRCSTMYSTSNGSQNQEKLLDLSPVHKSRTANRSPKPNEERDKSSKRKSNLNRSLNEEATPDGDDSAMRRRRRRELGMSRPLVPSDDGAVKALISPHKTRMPSPTKLVIRNDLSYHMEMARRGLDLATTSDRRRAQTASPKTAKDSPSPKANNAARISKRSDTVAIGELRKERSTELNRKLNERTRTGLEEIMKIVENVSDGASSSSNPLSDLTQTMQRLGASQERERENEKQQNVDALSPLSKTYEVQRRPSPVKHATFVQEECIYYEPDPVEHIESINVNPMLRSFRMLKAKSIERETAAPEPAKQLSPILRRKSTDCPPNNSLTGVANASTTPNHIVSILKKKDHLSAGESSSASSNASPVTFSSSVMDTPSKQKRAGILKKRSSLDESRYYSRSHSPDERSILIKSARRNSLEEVANGSSSSSSAQGTGHHGILKQSSYDSSKSDGCPSATREPQSILKKKDSTSTPSDGGDHAPKHVSISQAVILAAAELSAANEIGDSYPNNDLNYTPTNEEYDIKPILKLDSSTGDEPFKPPKPILKKKSSGDSDEHEIKPILKTSRKSSREEFEFGAYSDSEGQQEPVVKPILKTDSPSKRRSLGDGGSSNADEEQREKLSPFLLKRRTRSLERQDKSPVIDLAAALNAIATSQALPSELVSSLTNSTAGSNISVAERIKSVEKFLANQSGDLQSSPSDNATVNASTSAAVNTTCETSLQNESTASNAADSVQILKPSVIRRDLYKDRYKTQPVTSDEKNFFKNNISSEVNDDNSNTLPAGSAFKPAQSLEGFGFGHLSSPYGHQSPNTTPSAFTLTRSLTQPLSTSALQTPPQSTSSFKAFKPVPLPRKFPNRSSLVCANDTNNSTLSFAADSELSFNNTNGERTFEMSSLDTNINVDENQEPTTPLNKDTSESSVSSTGLVRTNSVKARANMFQQLQEKTNNSAGLNREDRSSPRRAPRRLSPSPAVNADEPKTPNNPPQNPDDEIASSSSSSATTNAAQNLLPAEAPRGILKSKSGCVGFMPMDLSNELKNRLKSSKHATVSNLAKSATTNLAAASTAQHDDAVHLVRNLTNLGRPPIQQLRDPMKLDPDIASASEGESSGGREITEIIKNSAIARRRKFNEGFYNAKLKNYHLPPPPSTAQHFWPFKKQIPSYYVQQQQILKQQQLQQLQQKQTYK